MKNNYQISFTPDAYQDLNNATKWYENEKIGLGKRFYKSVSTMIGTLSENPFLFAVRYKGIRGALVEKFPFSIFYLVEEGQQCVHIIAILHNAQNPEIWEERTV